MKILLTGGGSGGHFYPIIAVAQEIRAIARKEHLLQPELIYMAPSAYDKEALLENDISFRHVDAGKQRRYSSLKNFFDIFKIALGTFKALIKIFFIFPDIVFSKGGYPSVPVLFAARFFGIPVIIHESDSVPGRANAWAAKFAKRIAVSYPQTAELFEEKTKAKNADAKIAVTGNPIRRELKEPTESGAREFLHLEKDTPVLLILGGSQGAQSINETIVEALPELVKRYEVIHQIGKGTFNITKQTANIILDKNELAYRYKPFDFLNVLAMRMAAGVATIVVSRAGSGAIFEIATWGKPSILIPIPEDVSHDQHKNAFAYARSGAATVIEQPNLSPYLLVSEINHLMDHEDARNEMSKKTKEFAEPEAAHKIAREILDLALEHES